MTVVQRFLRSIAERPDDAVPTRRGFTSPTDLERQVMRFAWTAEELNVALDDLELSERTLGLLLEHAVPSTLIEIRLKAAKLIRAIDAMRRATSPSQEIPEEPEIPQS